MLLKLRRLELEIPFAKPLNMNTRDADVNINDKEVDAIGNNMLH